MKKKLLEHYANQLEPGPLQGIIVVGFCYYVAGPIALQSLVRQGALVIKLEGQPIGDPSRHVFSPSIFNSLTHGQLSVAFDYTKNKDRQLLHTLLQVADVILDNRSVDARERDGILQNYLTMSNKTHQKIYCMIDGFPNSKIHRMPGLDASVQAITGFAYSNCYSASEPLKVGVPLLDIVTGLLAANCITANLFYLEKKQYSPAIKDVIHIAVSLAGTSMWLQSHQMINALEGKEYFRKGNQDRFAAPFSYYTTQNGLISIATVNEKQFETFCFSVLNNKDFHQKYPTIHRRIAYQDDFEQELNTLLKEQPKEYWLEQCQIHKVPAAPVLTATQAIQQDFFKELLSFSTDQKPIISAGIAHSLFAQKKEAQLGAPSFNQDYDVLSHLLTIEEGTSLKHCAKL